MIRFLIGIVFFVQISTPLCRNRLAVTECKNINLQQIVSDSLGEYRVYLSLRQSYLPQIAACTFQTYRKLEKLFIIGCNLRTVDVNAFSRLSNLKELSLYNNQLKEVRNEAFTGLDSLKKLNLGVNEIEQIDDEAFQDLLVLEELNLDHNKLDRFPITIKYLLSLKVLRISNNEIRFIAAGVLPNLSELTTLNFEGNRLEVIAHNELGGLRKLVKLNIKSNGITDLDDANLIECLPSLKNIEVDLEEFKCERLQSIIERFRKENVTISDGFYKSVMNVRQIACKL